MFDCALGRLGGEGGIRTDERLKLLPVRITGAGACLGSRRECRVIAPARRHRSAARRAARRELLMLYFDTSFVAPLTL